MKNTMLKLTVLSVALLGADGLYAAGGKQSTNSTTTSTQTVSQLTSFEISSLTAMREEEKMARDVYLTLYTRWGIPVFENIASSEQTHTDKVAELIQKYGIVDPVKSNEIGVFTDPVFTQLYTDLVNKGSESYEAALKVGAEIEELDIADIRAQLKLIKKTDIINTYNNLEKGSRNHLRSFYSLIVQGGFEYTPVHLTQEEFDAIVNSESETGNINTTTTTSSTTTRGGRR